MAANIVDIIEFLRTFAHQHDPDRVLDAEQALQPLGESHFICFWALHSACQL
jgi:hypothetical protein